MTRTRRNSVRALVAVATLLGVVAIFAVFANRQVLNADNWSETSSQLLDNSNVRAAVSAFLVDQVYSSVDVRGEVAGALPPRAKRLAGPAASGLRSLAERGTNLLLERPRVQQAWQNANRITAQQFIDIAEGNSKAVSTQGNAVILDLRVILLTVVQRLGLPGTLAKKVPPTAGRIKIMDADQVKVVQDGASVLKGLSIVLPALALGLLALAVYLAHGRRRETLMAAGVSLVIAGALVLILRNVVGDHVVNSLAKTAAAKPTAEAVWSIGTRLLHDAAQATIVVGIPVLLAAWLAGPTSLAVAFRRNAAPWLRDRPGVTYGVVGAVVLLILAWGPIPATRMPIPVLIMIGLVVLGVEALRRQVAVEFPDSTPADVRASLRAAIASARGRNGATRAAVVEDDRVANLERLSALHDSGALSDEEFAAEKLALRAPGAAV